MVRLIIPFVAIFCLSNGTNTFASTPEGTITGAVFEAGTNSSIPGSHIQIIELEKGTTSNSEGYFRFENVPAGVYTVRASFVGFRTRVFTDIVVHANRVSNLEIELRESIFEGDEVMVTGGYFYHNESQPVSHVSMNAEEIRRSPGSGQELSRVIMAFPGVASKGEMSQDLLVRGGSPRENAFYIDNIFIPTVQHFEQSDGSSNGPTGLVNTDLVEQLSFSAGGFSAAYGERMSSVADIRYRDGNRERLQGNVNMNMAGFGGSLEFPFAGGKGSWLVSARRSYLDLIADAVNSRGAPRYGDIQIKGVYDPDRNNRITLLQVYGTSILSTTADEGREDGWLSYPQMENRQQTTGINWRSFQGESITVNTSLSYSGMSRELVTRYVEDDRLDVRIQNRHEYIILRNVTGWRASDRHRFEFGGDATYTSGNFDYYYSSFLNEAGVERPEIHRTLDKRQFTGELFGSYDFRPVESLSITTGGRFGYNTINRQFTFSPRMSIYWEVSDRVAMTAAAGIYRQSMPLFLRSQQPEFDELSDPQVTHLIAGIDYLLGEVARFSVEVYDKKYRDMPLQPAGYSDGPPSYVFDTQTFYDDLTDQGKGFARGVDVMLQRKITEGFYGTVSFSWFRSRYRDFEGNWRNRDYDVKTLFSVIGGYRPNDNWEFSARWSYVGDRPYTPLDQATSAETGQTILDLIRFNSEHLPAFHSLYLRFDRRFFFNRWTLVTFMELWNSYNRSNVTEVYWNRNENRVSEINQFDLLPVGGFIIEF